MKHIQEELNASWVNAVSWKCLDLKHHLDGVLGAYRVNLNETISHHAPHQLIMHGTDANIIAMYQSVIQSLFAYKNGLFKINPLKRDISFSKIRRKEHLYVSGPESAIQIEGYTQEQSLDEMQSLHRHILQPENLYIHHWQKGDLIIWDNLMSIHRGYGNQPRLLYKAQARMAI